MMVNVSTSPLLSMASQIALTHHERWDGHGYPIGLAGEDIPISGRIVAVADVFDALSNKRPYKPAFPMEKCFAILDEGRGTQFDPKVIEAFKTIREDILNVRIALADID
jgi:putative two-component system response regulator